MTKKRNVGFFGVLVFSVGLLSSVNVAWASHTLTKHSTTSAPVLMRFVQQLWASNPKIQSLQAEVDKSQAEASASNQPLYNPNIELAGQRVNKEPLEDTYTAGVSQTIDWAGKRQARTQVGQADLAATQASLADAKLTLAVEALQDLAAYQTQQAIVQTIHEQERLLKRFDEQTRKQFKAGDVAKDAVNQADLAYADILGQLAQARAKLSESAQDLQVLTNQTSKHWPRLPAYLPSTRRATATQQAQWLQQLPAIQTLTAEVNGAQAGVRVAETNAKPDPTVSLTGGEEDHEALVAASVSIPLFVRNNYQAQIVAAGANVTAIEQQRLNRYRAAKAALSGSRQRYSVLRQAYVQWYQVSQPSLNAGIALLNRLWRAGELNTTNYLVQLKQRLDSRITGHRLLGEAWQAWFAELQANNQLVVWLHHTTS